MNTDDLENKKVESEVSEVLSKFNSLTATSRELRSLVRALTNETEELKRDLLVAVATKSQKPISIKPVKSKKKTHYTPLCLWSDHHIDEPVPEEQGNGNVYNPKIADQRFERLIYKTIDIIKSTQSSYRVSEAIVWCGGDFFSGMIHPDLSETVIGSGPDNSLRVYDMLKSGLTHVADSTGLKIYVPCSWGNHGRLTPKPRVSTAGSHNLEQIVYRSLERDMDSRFKFDVSNTAFKYLDLGDYTIRFNHGDRGLRFGGGIGGLSIPLHKWRSRLDEARKADLSCIGHWHQARDFSFALVNGSMIGDTEYSAPFGTEPPCQVVALIDRSLDRKGPVYPVYLDK
jgi:hypothetical protein|tara:strand:+ start:2072 stop:3097 length:1026 start_codon:yes stop_codon:yes gene_type:complete